MDPDHRGSPPWPTDPLGQFIGLAKHNIAATAHNCPAEWNRLRDIDALFATAADNLDESPEWFAALFLVRSHSAFRAAVRLSASGQIPEAFAMMRSGLEYALYGHYLGGDTDRQTTWLTRSNSPENRKAFRREFTIRKLADAIKARDAWLSDYAERMYDFLIDYGAHPNDLGLAIVTSMHEDAEKIRMGGSHLQAGGEAFMGCLQINARVGLACLLAFAIVFRERFDLLGLTPKIDALKRSDKTLGMA